MRKGLLGLEKIVIIYSLFGTIGEILIIWQLTEKAEINNFFNNNFFNFLNV